MPVRIGDFGPTTQERVERLRRNKGKRTDPRMMELIDSLETGEPQEVTVEAGRNAKGLRIAIARAAGNRGVSVETFEDVDEAFNPVVVVVKADRPQPRPAPRTTDQASSGKRRGRPRKEPREEMVRSDADISPSRTDAAEIASLQDLASNEA